MVEESPPDKPSEAYEYTRNRGFLTEADRKYLVGDSEIEPRSHSERQARARIRDRVYHAFLDMVLVENELESRDRDQIFERLEGDTPRILSRMSSILAEAGLFHGGKDFVQYVIREGVRRGVEQQTDLPSEMGVFVQATLEIELRSSDEQASIKRRIVDKLKRGEGLASLDSEEWVTFVRTLERADRGGLRQLEVAYLEQQEKEWGEKFDWFRQKTREEEQDEE